MGRPNVHKVLGRSQLSKKDMGTLERNSPTRPERAQSGDLTRRVRPNDATREKMANGLPEHAQGTRVVTT